MDSTDAVSRSRCSERRLNKILAPDSVAVLILLLSFVFLLVKDKLTTLPITDHLAQGRLSQGGG